MCIFVGIDRILGSQAAAPPPSPMVTTKVVASVGLELPEG